MNHAQRLRDAVAKELAYMNNTPWKFPGVQMNLSRAIVDYDYEQKRIEKAARTAKPDPEREYVPLTIDMFPKWGIRVLLCHPSYVAPKLVVAITHFEDGWGIYDNYCTDHLIKDGDDFEGFEWMYAPVPSWFAYEPPVFQCPMPKEKP